MNPHVQCLSWDPAGFFFRDVVGLPLLGQRGNNWDDKGSLFVFWGGEAVEFELLPGAGERPVFDDPVQQPQVPVFRSFALEETLEGVVAGGGRIIVDREEPGGRTVYFLDPSGSVNGLRAPDPGSTDPVDVTARARHLSGGTHLRGVAAMPAGVFDLGWIQLHVADVAAEAAFYRDVVGLDVVADRGPDGVVLSLGDIGRLEIKPGGSVQATPEDRADAPEMWMLRVRDIEPVVAHLKASGVHFVNDPWFLTGGWLAYFVDPEGQLVGIQDHPNDGRPQEIEAERRWLSR
jgi:predicted enzyme related to lactoylglutathione lyase